MSERELNQKEERLKVQTFPVPFAIGEIKEAFNIATKTPSKPSKRKILNQAFKFHNQGKIPEAVKYYQNFINQGFKDHRVFSNYGTICRTLGKLKKAELLQRKAIDLTTDFSPTYRDLGI